MSKATVPVGESVPKPHAKDKTSKPIERDANNPMVATSVKVAFGSRYCNWWKVLKILAVAVTVLGGMTELVKYYREERDKNARSRVEEEHERQRILPKIISEKHQQSIVTITAGGVEATGFIMKDKGKKYVYSARHVVMDRHAAVEDGLAFTIAKGIEVRSFCNDIVPIEGNCECAITDGGNVRGAPWVDAVRFATSTELPALHSSEDAPRLGDEVFVIGHRMTSDGLCVERGIVTTVQSDKGVYVIHNAKTSKGFSGGPIFDCKGNVVAMESCEPDELDLNGEWKGSNKFGVRLSACQWVCLDEEPRCHSQAGKFFADYEKGVFGWKDFRGQTYYYNCGIWRVPEDEIEKFVKTYSLNVTHKDDGCAEYTLNVRTGAENDTGSSLVEWKISDIDVNTPVDVYVISVLANSLYFGYWGCETNAVLASKLYKVAAEKGDPMAQYNIGVCYANGYGVDKNELMAFKFFQDSAIQKTAIAQYALAECYFYGRGCKKDENQEVYWLKKAADQSLSAAEWLLGMYCLRNRENDEAIRYLYNAKKGGVADASFALGQCYEFGIGVERNLDQAQELYQEAEKNGSALAIVASSQQHLKKGDFETAIRLIEKAAGQGEPFSSILLGDCYLNGLGVTKDPARAFDIYRAVALSGNPMGLCALGYCHVNGIGTETNFVEAVKVFRKASEFMFPPALYGLGGCYSEGLGVESNEVKAVEWYQKAADMDYAPAQCDLGWCYAQGFGVLSNATKAVEWYQKAADIDYAPAQCELGWCYAHGFGVSTNAAKSVEWYKKASDLNYPVAQYELGKCYEDGFGVEANRLKAIEYYEKAARGGDKDAVVALKRLDSNNEGRQ